MHSVGAAPRVEQVFGTLLGMEYFSARAASCRKGFQGLYRVGPPSEGRGSGRWFPGIRGKGHMSPYGFGYRFEPVGRDCGCLFGCGSILQRASVGVCSFDDFAFKCHLACIGIGSIKIPLEMMLCSDPDA